MTPDLPPGPSLIFDPIARTYYDRYTSQFAADLLDEANEAALRERRGQITLDHIANAREKAYARRRTVFSRREFLLIVGAALLGSGFENGASEAVAGNFSGAFALWVCTATIGAILIILALALL